MPDSLLFEVIGRLIDSLTVVLDNLGWWMGMLGPDTDPIRGGGLYCPPVIPAELRFKGRMAILDW